MNADDIATLRSRGARLGESNESQWRELVTVFGLEKVRYAVVQAKISTRKPQVLVEEAATQLKHKLREIAAPAKAKAAPVSTPPEPVKPKLTPVEPVGRESPAPKHIDYLALLRDFGPITVTEIAARARVKDPSVYRWLKLNAHLVVVSGSQPRRYAVAGTPAAITAPKPVIEEEEEVELEQLESAAEPPAQAAEPPADEPAQAVPEMWNGEPAPEVADAQAEAVSLLPTAPPLRAVTALAFTVTDDELAGDLLPLVTRLLDVYADRHGFSRAYAQTNALRHHLFTTSDF